MLDPSASIAPTLASPGTALAAVPAGVRAEGAAMADFSAVLAGLNLGVDLAEAPETAPPPPADLAAIQAATAGKTIAVGNRPGKILPAGKQAAETEAEDHRDPEAKLTEAEPQRGHPPLNATTTSTIQDQLAPQQHAAAAAPTPEPAANAVHTPHAGSKPQAEAPVLRTDPRPSHERQALKTSTALPPVAAAPLPRDAQATAPVMPAIAPADAPTPRPVAAVPRSPALPVSPRPTPVAMQAGPSDLAPVLQPAPVEHAQMSAEASAAVTTPLEAAADPDIQTSPRPSPDRPRSAALSSVANVGAPSVSQAPIAAAAPVLTQFSVAADSRSTTASPQSSKRDALAPDRSAAPASTAGNAAQPAAVPTPVTVTPSATIAAAEPAEVTRLSAAIVVEAAATTAIAPVAASPALNQSPVAAPVLAANLVPVTSGTPAATPAPIAPAALKVEVVPLSAQAPIIAEATMPVAIGASVTPTITERPRFVAHIAAETLHTSFTARSITPGDVAPSNILTAAPDSLIATNLAAAPLNDARPVSALTASQAPAGPDLAALVDRIVEARAAAAPDTVRAALVHQEFGSVSLQLRTEDKHIQVTLGSADPTFAPAVHAAAAASLAGTTQDGGREGERREQAAHHQPNQQPGHEASAANAHTSQQHQSARNSASTSERVPSRDNGPTRSPSEQPHQGQAASDRRSGIYA